jgi:hypothetical protein
MASPPRIKDIKVSAKKDQLKLSTASNLYQKQNNSATLKQSRGFKQAHNSSGMDLDDIVGLDEIGSGELHVYN